MYRIWLNDKVGVVDTTNRVIFEPQFELVGTPEDSFIPIKINDKWGFLDSTGTIMGELHYEKIPPYVAGLKTFVEKRKIGLKREDYKILFPAEFDRIWKIEHNIIAFQKDGLTGYADTTGKWIWHPSKSEYDAIKTEDLIEKLHTIDSVYDPVIAQIGSRGKKVIPQVLEKLKSQEHKVALRAAWVLRHMADADVLSRIAKLEMKQQTTTGLTAIDFCMNVRKDLCTFLKSAEKALLENVLTRHSQQIHEKKTILLYNGNLAKGIQFSIPSRKITLLSSEELQEKADRKGQIAYSKFDKIYVFSIPKIHQIANNEEILEAVALVSFDNVYKQSRKAKACLLAGGGSTSIWFKINGNWVFQGVTSSWIS